MNPIKRNMEEGSFSLMRCVYRNTSQSKTTNYNGSTLNITYQDSSSRIQRLKAIATGKEIKTAKRAGSSKNPDIFSASFIETLCFAFQKPSALGIAFHVVPTAKVFFQPKVEDDKEVAAAHLPDL